MQGQEDSQELHISFQRLLGSLMHKTCWGRPHIFAHMSMTSSLGLLQQQGFHVPSFSLNCLSRSCL